MGKPKGVLIVCEGFATGASIHEATGHAVAVAFNAGNLEAVALAMRAKFPALRLTLAADDDHLTTGNPGMTKATAAARAVGGLVAVPVFPGDRPDKATDFNDLHQLAGLEAVRAGIEAARAADTQGGTADEWPDPVPLPDALTPVMPFDPELLPEALRGWVADGAHRMQCPPDFMAVGAVVALSSLIGARAVVAPKERDDWRVVPNLWGLIVGRPGVMKSPALSEAMRPLHRLESTEREQWQAAHEAWSIEAKMAEMGNDAREKQARGLVAKDPAAARELLTPTDGPTEPTMRRFVVNDATVEKLGEILTVNPWGLLVFRDELHGLLCSMDRQGQEGARGFYLTGYDGNQGHAVDRIGRGETYIPRVCIAMLGGIQPGKIQSYVRDAVAGGSGDDGLLQRFGLAVWPDVEREFKYVNQWPDTPAKQTAWAVFERLAALQPATDTDPQEWRFSPEAQALFVEWLVPFETELRGDDLHPALVSHLAKYRKLVPALALIFALVDTPDSGGVIQRSELMRALAMSEYLRSHAERVYAAAVIPETGGAEALLSKIKAGKLRDGDGVLLETFTPRLVAVKNWAGLGTPDAVRKASELLEIHGWLKRDDVASGVKGGRPSERYRINPAVLGGGAV
jgi:putative DNA primase/helicase